jgi:hypothetical protein
MKLNSVDQHAARLYLIEMYFSVLMQEIREQCFMLLIKLEMALVFNP